MSRTSAPPIPLVLVRLKLRLLRNPSGRRGKAAPVLGLVGMVVFGLVGFGLMVAAGHASDPREGRGAVVIGATALMLGWSLLPLLTFGTDDTLDPARLQLLPLERRPLLTGLLLSSLIGFGPVAVLATLVGVVVGFRAGAATIVVVLAVVLLALMCAACARMLATLLAASLTSRRGRDLVVVIGASVAIGVQFLRFVRFDKVHAELVAHISNVLRWLPPGMLGQAVVDARNGRWLHGLAELLPALILVPLFVSVWGRALDRSLTVVSGGATKARRAATDDADAIVGAAAPAPAPLRPRYVRRLPAGATGAIAAKELRYVARDPRRKVQLAQIVVLGIGGPLYYAIKVGHAPRGAVLIASLAGYVAIVGAMNQFGFDGGALWVDIVAGNVVRDELVGKNLALLVEVLPVVLVSSVALAVFTGGWIYVPAALLLAAAGLGAGMGVANVVSVRYPVRLPESRSPFAGRAAGQGCVTSLVLTLAAVLQAVILAPVAIAAGLCVAFAPLALVIVAPACAVYGYGLWQAGTKMAERWAWWRQPELLLAVDARRGV
jgi:ABC-2 type transport system permease protein